MIRRIEKIILVLLFFIVTFAVIYHPTEPVFIGEFNNRDGSIYAVRFVDGAVFITIFFIVAFLLIPRTIVRRKPWPFILGSVVLLTMVSAAEYGLDRLILELFNLPTGAHEVSDKMMQSARRIIYHSSIIPGNLMVYVLGCLYGLSRDWIFKTRRQSQLIREKMQADMMRYVIYDSNVESVCLDVEIKHLRKYIDLMCLKFGKNDPLDIWISQKGVLKKYHIAPLILLPFVENAFKHGITTKGEGVIRIDMDVQNCRFLFRIENTVQSGRKDFRKHPGIGLDNVKKRLSLIYPDKHHLQITQAGDHYTVDLNIDLKE